jgi:hypothetical protein
MGLLFVRGRRLSASGKRGASSATDVNVGPWRQRHPAGHDVLGRYGAALRNPAWRPGNDAEAHRAGRRIVHGIRDITGVTHPDRQLAILRHDQTDTGRGNYDQ